MPGLSPSGNNPKTFQCLAATVADVSSNGSYDSPTYFPVQTRTGMSICISMLLSRWQRPFGPITTAWMTLSVRPNPHDLLPGRLDDQLHAIIRSAPAHSELAFWHENIPGNPLDYPSYVNNPVTARRMQRYGQWLCRGTKVRFGVIICGPAVQMPEWIATSRYSGLSPGCAGRPSESARGTA